MHHAIAPARGTVFNIMRFSINDGPGIRSTVFLKGCPLSCLWCHNPESLQRTSEIVLREDRCIQCGECIDACSHGAIRRRDGRVATDRDLCVKCGECISRCAADAREQAGREMTVDEVLREVLQDRIFFDQSNGGVTFSGGEPLLQHEFLQSLLTASREEGLHTAVDTSGFASPAILSQIAPLVDLFLYDLKIMDDEKHISCTGVSNKLPLENLERLVLWGKRIIVRIPLVPGVNDDPESVRASGRLLAGLQDIQEVHLLPYHGTGAGKYARLGKTYSLSSLDPPDHGSVTRVLTELRKYVPRVIVGG